MAIEAKAGFLNRIEQAIAENVTAAAMPKILAKIADLMELYEIRERPQEETTGPDCDMLKAFLDAMRVKGLSKKTLYRYEYVIGKLLKDVQVSCRQITVHHLRDWLAKEQARGLALSTLDGDRQVFSTFFGWLYREGLIERSPTLNLAPIKVPKKKKKIFTDVELDRLHRAAAGDLRDTAIISFLESSACRVSELCELNKDCVDLERGEVIVHGKGDKERLVMLSEVAVDQLRTYLKSRRDWNEALFLSEKKEKRLEPGGVRVMLNRVAALAGVEHVHPHKFRRTWATNAARYGMPIHQISALLGHEKIDTTMKYVILNDNDLRNSYRKYA